MEKTNFHYESCELLKAIAISVYERKKPEEKALCFSADEIQVVEKFLADFFHSRKLAGNTSDQQA